MSSIQQVWEPARAMPTPATVSEEPRWYAIHTRARHEKAVTAQLERIGVTTFLPLIRQTHRWSDRQKTVQWVLFDCYTFVCLETYAKKHRPVLETPGVIGFVGGEKPQPLKADEIERITADALKDARLWPQGEAGAINRARDVVAAARVREIAPASVAEREDKPKPMKTESLKKRKWYLLWLA